MNIYEAMKLAHDTGTCVTRPTNGIIITKIRPTNKDECCELMYLPTGQVWPRWNPSLEDFLAQDWCTIV